MALTTIAIWKKDHERFLKAQLKHSSKKGKKVSQQDFFTILMNRFEGKNEN